MFETKISTRQSNIRTEERVLVQNKDGINIQISQKQGKDSCDKNLQINTDLTQQKIYANVAENTSYSGAIKRNIIDKNEIGQDKTIVTKANDDTQFTVVQKKRRRTQLQTTFGTAVSDELKGITRYAHLHVFGFAPNTTETIITTYLSKKDINETKIEQLKSRRPEEYASYKISVPLEVLEEAQKPSLWPTGVKINRFLERIWLKSQQKT